MAQSSSIRMKARNHEDNNHSDKAEPRNKPVKNEHMTALSAPPKPGRDTSKGHHDDPVKEKPQHKKPDHDRAHSNSDASREYHPDKERQNGFFSKAGQALSSYTSKHGHAVFYGIVGFIIAACILIIGFWETLLLVIFIALGSFIGRYHDGDKKTRDQVNGLLKRLT